MDDIVDSFRCMQIWNKEENYDILVGALTELSELLQNRSTAEPKADVCKKHIERIAFYSYLVHHCSMNTYSEEHVLDSSIESEILIKDIDRFIESRPLLAWTTLQTIHKFDQRLLRILDDR